MAVLVVVEVGVEVLVGVFVGVIVLVGVFVGVVVLVGVIVGVIVLVGVFVGVIVFVVTTCTGTDIMKFTNDIQHPPIPHLRLLAFPIEIRQLTLENSNIVLQ